MEEIYHSEYVKHIYYPQKQVLEAVWTEGGLMNDEEYRKESLNFLKTANTCKAYGNLIDTQDFQFTIVPKTQEWLNTIVFPKLIATGVKKMAFLVTEELFAQVSIEQTMEEDTAKEGFQTYYFKNRDEAMLWLEGK